MSGKCTFKVFRLPFYLFLLILLLYLCRYAKAHRDVNVNGLSCDCFHVVYVDLIHWIYFTYPDGKEPAGNVWKGEPLLTKKKVSSTASGASW